MSTTNAIKLSDLTAQIEAVLYKSFSSSFYWIIAEISSHKFYPNDDRHYFDFIEKAEGQKDPTARVRGVAWKSGSLSIKRFETATGQEFSNGLQVLAQVKVEFHQAYGISLQLTDIDPSFTLGNIERQRRETLVRLVTENPESVWKEGDEYFSRNKQLNIGRVIQKVAVIASPNSEGYRDFIHTLENNQFSYKFSIDTYQSTVQGGLAEREMIERLIKIFNS
ncbi:MAG TPA: exodeoxyribonuclease VII large subunit, partial [Chitinophagaceae bacterium]